MGYLIRQGHERIKHLAGPPDWSDARSRLRAYDEEMRAADLPVLPPVYGNWTADSGYEAGLALLREAARGDAGRPGGSAQCSPRTTRWRLG